MKKHKRKLKRKVKRAAKHTIIASLVDVIPAVPGQQAIKRFLRSLLSTFSLNILFAALLAVVLYLFINNA